MAKVETTLVLEFPAEKPEDLLTALTVRDLLHGSSYDVEDEQGNALSADFVAGDELDGSLYRLLIGAEVEGTDDSEVVGDLTEQIVDDLIGEAEALVAERVELGRVPLDELEFRPVAEDDERWDLIVPDWLAPDGAEVPFGFRAFRAGGGAWPDDDVLDAHGRVVLLSYQGEAYAYGIPAPEAEEPDQG